MKFQRRDVTADGEARASVALRDLETLWFNAGSLCNLACAHCYMRSSPTNRKLAYLTLADVEAYLDEIQAAGWSTRLIGFTGGEPFMAPEILAMMEASLARGFDTLVLSNGMRPMMKKAEGLEELNRRYPGRLVVRISLDHYTRAFHEWERGPGTWNAAVDGLLWLAEHGIRATVAGRTCWNEGSASLRGGYAGLFAELGLAIDAWNEEALVLFPEMNGDARVPEISARCWELLGSSPDRLMCARSRMVLRRGGASRPTVVACTLLPWHRDFEMGETLEEASGRVWLNHPHCASFCVLGGGSCALRADGHP